MKLSLLVICTLTSVCLSFSEAAEDASSMIQNGNKISINKENIQMHREIRSADKKAKKSGGKHNKKSGRKNNKKSGRKNNKKSARKNNKKSARKNNKKSARKNNKKSGRKSNKKSRRKSAKNENKKRKKGGNQIVQKKGRKSIKPNEGDKRSKSLGRANLVGSHCDFVDLCVIDRMSTSGCNMGDKFVIKSPKGTRRQFLMVDGSKIIAFLKNGKKITDCQGNLTDVTSRVTCKAVAGAGTLKLQRQNVTNETTTVAAPAPATTLAPTTAEAPTTDEMPPLQAGQFHCPCPQRTCFTKITSTNNKHKIECGSKTYNVPCGGPLKGSKIGLLISIIDVFEQPLCSTNTYVTLIKDLVWKCSNLTIPEDAPCEGDAPAQETAAPVLMTGYTGDTTTASPETNNTSAGPVITTANASVPTTDASATTTASVTTTTASVTTTSASVTTTTASVTTTTASVTTTTASVTTTTASATTTTTTASATTTTTT